MKKIMLFIVLLALLQLTGAPVSQRSAVTAAANWYIERISPDFELSSVVEITESGETVMYGVNFCEGYVLIAANDVSKPVFGYSSEGSFSEEDLPPALEMMLNWQKSEIAYSIAIGEEADAETALSWERLLTENFTPQRNMRDVSPLLNTSWNQGQYYNALCPSDPSGPAGHVWAGCVATAMAQVMKFWSYPETGVGSHSYYDDQYGLQSANFGATTYNWSLMPNNVTSSNTSVATLMYHLGVSVDMDYGVNGSGAYSDDARNALVNYFQYKSTAQLLYKNDYTSTTWNNMVQNELDEGRPLYWRGQNSTSGHAFNLDGYQGTDYFHINWGWSGSYNGYFSLDDLTPGSSNYSLQQAGIFYLEPDFEPVITVTSPNGGEVYDIGDILSISWTSEYVGSNVSIMLYDGYTMEEVISSQTSNDGTFLWTIPGDMAPGSSYRINITDHDDASVYDYSDSPFTINDPVYEEIQSTEITIDDAVVNLGDSFTIGVYTTEILADWNIISYQFTLEYDPSVLEYTGYQAGVFAGNLLAFEQSAGSISIAFANAFPLSGSGALAMVEFDAIAPGNVDLSISDMRYNTYDISNLSGGDIVVNDYNPFDEVVITVGSEITAIGNQVEIPVSTSMLTSDLGVISFQFDLEFDNSLLSYESFSIGEVPNAGNLIANESEPGILSVAYANVMPVEGEGTLCMLTFTAEASGSSDLLLNDFKYNSTYLSNLVNGVIEITDLQYPDWAINPPDYEYSGSIWGVVMLDDEEVELTTGMLGCFVGDECRGIAYDGDNSLQYFEYFGRTYFMPMVYSNQTSGETLRFEYFDPITQEVYSVSETLEFTADMTVGDGFDPIEFHASTVSTIDISRDFVNGWNWFSLNVTGEDMSANGVLASIGSNASNIKSQTQSAIYYPGPGWLGSLANINNLTFYKLNVTSPATWEYTGIPVDPATTTYDLTMGWNWLSYAPQSSLNINTALGEITLGTNIKSQTQSAIYYPGPGWLGSLTTMNPTYGYMLQMSAEESFNYPDPQIRCDLSEDAVSEYNTEYLRTPDWMINPPDYEYNGSIWAIINVDGEISEDTNDWLGLFHNDECRGIAQAEDNSVQYMEYFGNVYFLPMAYSNQTSGEILTFKYYDSSEDVVYDILETVEFTADMVIGDGFDPLVLHTSTISSDEDEIAPMNSVCCYPNPFNPSVAISFHLDKAAQVSLAVYNSRGQKVRSFDAEYSSGTQQIVWNGKDDNDQLLANGVYFYQLNSEDQEFSGKMIMLK